jgi:cation/acetate symporter
MLVGAFTAIALVMVSPNMTYPLAVKATAQATIDGAPAKLEKANASLASAADDTARAAAQKAVDKLNADVKAAQGKIDGLQGQTTSLVGLEKPLTTLRNPGIISIPLGFLCVFLGSLFYKDKRAEDMWDELYVRQNTGIHAEGAAAH